MSKRNRKPAADLVADTTADTPISATIETAEIETAETIEPVVDADVLAMLAGDDEPAVLVASDEPEITADDVDPATDEEVLAALNAPTKTKRAPKGTTTPSVAVIQRAFTTVAQIDQVTLDANLAGCNAKKVREKADNLIASVQSAKKLSRYTKVAVAQLAAHGKISGKSMVDAFQAEGLSLGTARAQGQQMTALFRLIGAVAPEAGTRDLIVQDKGLIDELVLLAA